ncbi:MAG: hypothetical protein WCG29_07665 [Desulfomonile sp.]|nr:hypothetical protein [Deltaproteobacteria bacterium]
MRPQAILHILLITLCAAMIAGCTDDTTDLKQKMADLEKRMQKQEKDLKDFSLRFAPPKDFSADIQRIEDQQDRISQVIKTKVEPVNSKLEEFRDWAQDAQKDRDNVASKIKSLESSSTDLKKRLEGDTRELARIQKEFAANKKGSEVFTKNLDDLTKSVAEIRKEVLDNNAKLVNAVKKTLPKVKEAAVAELKDRLLPLEEGLASLRVGIENDRKAQSAPRVQPSSTDAAKDIQGLSSRIKDLEDVVTSQKTYLLEVGSKVHELEIQLRRSSNWSDPPSGAVTRR